MIQHNHNNNNNLSTTNLYNTKFINISHITKNMHQYQISPYPKIK